MEEKTKLVGTLALSFSLFCLALAIGYVGYGLTGWLKQVPAILSLVSDTSGQIAPVLENVTEVEHLIPPIIEEMAAVRKTVDKAVVEVGNTREAVPGILADLELVTREVENTVGQLPGVIDPVLVEVGKTRETIPDILEEVRLTREAMPVLMDRADQLIANAGKAGQQVGKGAMTGMVGGIISMPFGIVGGIGKGVAGLAGLEGNAAVTDEDLGLLREKLLDLAENGEEGDVATWKNSKTSNSGKITLLRKYVENDQECREAKIETFIKGQDAQVQTISGCKQADGSWAATQ
jgi:surface antigen